VTPQTATRVGPVYFQPLEQELSSVAQYLSGHLLNAGCGSRNINNYLLANAATKITSYDIASDDPDVIVGPLEAMPFEDGTFDSVLCNAVLEHVVDAEEAIRELARVVKPNGHIVVAVGNDGQFARLCEVAGLPELAEWVASQTFEDRGEQFKAMVRGLA